MHQVNDLKPHLTLLAGDIVDTPASSPAVKKLLHEAAEPLRRVAPRQPAWRKLYVTGNHDFFTGDLPGWSAHLGQMGWHGLHNDAVRIGNDTAIGQNGASLCVAGLEDMVSLALG